MINKDVIKKLIEIDKFLFFGDKDQAHFLIQELIKWVSKES